MEIVIFLLLVFLAGKVITVVGVVGAEAISPIIGAPVSAVGLGTCMFIPPLPPPLLRYDMFLVASVFLGLCAQRNTLKEFLAPQQLSDQRITNFLTKNYARV